MATLSIPNELANGDQDENLGDGDDMQENFESIKTFVNANVVHRDGSVSMTGSLEIVDPTLNTHAASKAYVDGLLSPMFPAFIASDGGVTIGPPHQGVNMTIDTVVRDDGICTVESGTPETRVVVAKTGIYLVACEVEYSDSASGSLNVTRRLGNGDIGSAADRLVHSSTTIGRGQVASGRLSGGNFIYLHAGDTIGLRIWGNGATTTATVFYLVLMEEI